MLGEKADEFVEFALPQANTHFDTIVVVMLRKNVGHIVNTGYEVILILRKSECPLDVGILYKVQELRFQR